MIPERDRLLMLKRHMEKLTAENARIDAEERGK